MTNKTKSKKKSLKKNKTHKKNKTIYTKKDFESGDGMLTSVWGPSLWHSLHTISFNYPVKPTKKDKQNYKKFILSLEHVLPCGYCRKNLKNNFKKLPLLDKHMKNRNTFSKYIYELHELINTMLGKTSGLTYEIVRDTYENFRSRCTINDDEQKQKQTFNKTYKKYISNINGKKNILEMGCTKPLYGKKSKCLIRIVPHDYPERTFSVDDQCIKKYI
jgi:hypothetical protein